jgi:DeoR/GlpR family transcriptional regulator of sugar metabolism
VLANLVGDYVKDQVLARRLGVSHATLKRDLHQICQQLGVTGRHHAGDAARRLGYVLPFPLDALSQPG